MTSLPESQTSTLLDIVAIADNFPPFPTPYPTHHPITLEPYVPFHLTQEDYQNHLSPVGLVRSPVLDELLNLNCPDFLFIRSSSPGEDGRWKNDVDCVCFSSEVVKGGHEEKGRVMQSLAERWRDEGKFMSRLEGWRNEKYMIYADPRSSAFKTIPIGTMSNGAFSLERAACALFGFMTNGVHMTAYEGEGSSMKIWVPRRSPTKPTWPSKLDNSVAGGIPAGMDPLTCMIKECAEEASLPEDLVRKRIRNVGSVSYFYITPDGYLQPEIEYTYDLSLPPRDSVEYVEPHPCDDEVESFALMSIPEVLDALHDRQFKPNCGLILVDFLIRHGFVTPENEPNLHSTGVRMHRQLGVAVPST
ncbi:hypothetical protein TREMEDRAFT_44834 [Tremella mesenterica DSM 1558]|uniref:uncharacterized protein n=1 Tax=Tremella mesenterica (strain ATCC 24925 / CBS 8224 / DSM 1558 / NBRC 9311 / NRRL Y-6157 / RJB 2259-6 / UBC 559-6) TaxID=578456 RepID=UPI0003F49EEE|nr:uncharacterized protein TREMEDRAFT_44834 [Tremella mesenterica DSM 1558]EIW67813.1 hypothetical protein TREMEDRAFT_44834 [Tremella mesenterica DSM 1558]